MVDPNETSPLSLHVSNPPSRVFTALPPTESLPDIPGFEVIALLGRGGMGAVYRANQLSLNREVAIKMILTGSSSEAERTRFRREAEGIARLRHPNIVQIYEVGEVRCQPYFVMELVEGGSLKDRLGGMPMQALEAAKLINTLAQAVHAAHVAGVVHRDLKPANILLTGEGSIRPAKDQTGTPGSSSTKRSGSGQSVSSSSHPFVPKITDFGLAKFLGDESGQTRTGDILGTPGYMAPEQASGRSRDIGPGTDIWALGVILYEAITGARPFRARDIDVLLAMIRSEDAIPPRRVVHGIPRDLETICLKCLRKEPSKRYASAMELAEDLERFLEGRPIQARPVGAVERAWKWMQRNKAITAFATTVTISLVSAIVGFAIHNERLSEQLGKTIQAEQNANREAEEKSRALEEKTRAEQLALDEAREKTKALREALIRQINLNAGNAQRAIADGDMFTAIAETLQVLKVVDGNDPDRTTRERVRLGMLLRRSPKLVQAWASEKPIHAAAFSPDGKLVAMVGEEGYIRLYDSATGELAGAPLLHHAGFLPLDGVPGYDLLFTPDGDKIVTAAGSHGVFITDVPSRRRFGVLMAHRDERLKKLIEELKNRNDPSIADVEAIFQKAGQYYTAPRKLQLSRDGNRLLAIDNTGGMQVWDLATRKPLTPILRHDTHTRIPTPVLSPDGLRLATIMREAADSKSYLQLFQVAPFLTIKKSPPFEDAYDDAPKQLTFTPDGHRVIAVSDRGSRMWSAIDGSAQPHSNATGSMMAYSADGQYDVRVGNNGIRISTVSTGHEIFAIPRIFVPTAPPVFSPDGLQVAVATFGGTVHICNRVAGTQPGAVVILPHTQEVTSVAFAPDARRVLTVCQDRVVRVWDLAGTDAAPQRIPGDGLAAMIAYSPDGRYMAKGFGTVRVYDTQTLEQTLRMNREGLRLLTAEFSGDGQRVLGATCMLGRTMTPPNPGPHLGWMVWDVQTKRRVGPVLRYPTGDSLVPHFGATISPDGQRVAWAGNQDGVQITDVETGKPTLQEPIPLPGGGEIDGLAFSPDGKRLVVKAKAIRVFDATTGQPISPQMELAGSMGRMGRVIFSADGHRIAACSVTRDDLPALGLWSRTTDIAQSGAARTGADGGGVVRVWDATTGKPLTPLLGLADQPTAIALQPPCGDQLLVASFDGTVRAWNLATGQAAFREFRHPSGIMHANYSSNGQWFGYTDLMGTTYLRESETGALLMPPMMHTLPGKGYWVAFRPDDRQVAVATGEDTLLWNLSPEQRPSPILTEVLDTLTGTANDPTGRAIRLAAPDLFRPDPILIHDWHRNRFAELRANRDEPTNTWPHINQLLAVSPRDPQLLLARAEIHIIRHNWRAALADVDAADGGHGIDAQAQLLRGRAYYEQGETRRALQAFDDAVELSPSLSLWLARLHRGKAKLALGDWAGGDRDIERALEAGSIPISDVCALALARLVNRRTEQPNYDTICRVIHLKNGGTNDPNLAAVMATTFACGPVQSVPANVAVELASRAVACDPSRTDYRFALGLAQYRAGKTADAVANLRLAEKGDLFAVRLKARLALVLATPEAEARQWLEKARVDLATAEAELVQGRSLPGTAWVEVEILRRQADARFKQ